MADIEKKKSAWDTLSPELKDELSYLNFQI